MLPLENEPQGESFSLLFRLVSDLERQWHTVVRLNLVVYEFYTRQTENTNTINRAI